MGSALAIRTDRFVTYRDNEDRLRRKTSLVVRVLDSFTGEPVSGRLRVTLTGNIRRKAVTNVSGYYMFFDVEKGGHKLLVEPDAVSNDYFLLEPQTGQPWSYSFERMITLPLANERSPIEEAVLVPKPSYLFPVGVTLLRGYVKRANQPVSLAVVKATYTRAKKDDNENTEIITIETATDPKGYYVLFFKALPEKEQNIRVEVVAQGQETSKRVKIKDGTTTIADFP